MFFRFSPLINTLNIHMKYIVTQQKNLQACDAWILPVMQQDNPLQTVAVANMLPVAAITAASKRLCKTFAATTLVHTEQPEQVVVLVQLGHKSDPVHEEIKQAISAGLHCLQHLDIRHIALDFSYCISTADAMKNTLRFIAAHHYRFDLYKKEAPVSSLQQVSLICQNNCMINLEALNRHIAAEITGQHYAKDLANHPGNICTPTYLAEQAQKLAQAHDLKIEILEEKDMKQLGMGSLLAVAQGSAEPAKLIVLHYQGTAADQPPHVLVGKGITFDTGGISLKPAAAMDEMKFDMSGAASVLGTMQALTVLRPAINVIGIVAAAENMPGSKATRPGDIVTSMSGKTIEILNTDAEGRLVLCDALTYAERFHPASIVDIATLTGACVVALGTYRSGLFSNDTELRDQLQAIAEQHDDLVWLLPMDTHYQKQLKSTFADMGNIGGKREAGAVTAACFLASFMEKQKWAHLDVAGTAWSGDDKKATGRPVPLLLNYLLKQLKKPD